MTSQERKKSKRNEEPTLLIIDAQSVKNTDCAEQKGYDAGKKISGIKRHIAVDAMGLPYAIHITTANISDRAGAIEMFTKCYNKKNSRTLKMFLLMVAIQGKILHIQLKGYLTLL